MEIVTDQDVHDALDMLVHKLPAKLAAAEGALVVAEHHLKGVKAVCMSASEKKTVAERENDALTHEAYKKAVDQLVDATTKREMLRAQRAGYEYQIEVWRTEQSNRRAQI